MATKKTSSVLLFVRSVAAGVLSSMAFTYLAHVFGKWEIRTYRPDPETTTTVLLDNQCAVFRSTHTLRPGFTVSSLEESFSSTKLAGSFMNFHEGHLPAMVIVSLAVGTLIFFARRGRRQYATRMLGNA